MNLSIDEIGALQELVNIGVGRAASILNEMLGFHIQLQVPCLTILPPLDLQQGLKQDLNGDSLSVVQMKFAGAFTGTAQLAFPKDSASMLVALLTGESLGTPDLDAVKIGTLIEVGNILLNGVMGSIGNIALQQLDYSLPTYTEGTVESLWSARNLHSDGTVLLAQTAFTIKKLEISGNIILILKVGSLDVLLTAIRLLTDE